MKTAEQRAQLDHLGDAYDVAVGKYASSGLTSMTEEEKTVFVVWVTDAEVKNGGFHQYFSNPSGDFASEVSPALERIGAPLAAAVIRRAVALFPDGGPAFQRAGRQAQLDAMGGRKSSMFEDLENAWYEHIEDLETCLAKYIRRVRGD
jgi:hypothetical protein